MVDTITVGTGPSYIAITPDGNYAYVTNVFTNNVSVINTNTNTVINTIPVGNCPFDIAITPDGSFAYVTNSCTNDISIIDINTNTVVNTIPNIPLPLGIAIANVDFPCPTPLNRMCIETTRIFDSNKFEEELKETFKLPPLYNTEHIQCDVAETRCNILNITTINKQTNLVNVKLQIKVIINFTSNYPDCYLFKKVVCFYKNVNLIKPEGADVCCSINNVTCSCMQPSNYSIGCHNKNLCCTIKVTATVKSQQLVQIEVPVLRSCEPN